MSIQCDLLSGLDSKSASHCLQDDDNAKTMFDDKKVYQRLNLSSKDYFKQFKTVAFEKVILYNLILFYCIIRASLKSSDFYQPEPVSWP